MQVELDDARTVGVEMLLQIHDGSIAFVPHGFHVGRRRQPFAAENLRVHPGNQHFFVIRSVEDSDASALGKITRGTPEKIML